MVAAASFSFFVLLVGIPSTVVYGMMCGSQLSGGGKGGAKAAAGAAGAALLLL